MAVHRFTATPAPAGKTGNMANVELPDEVVEALGGKRVPVTVTVNGFTFSTTTAVMGGKNLVGFNTANKKAAGVEAGVPVEVVLEVDTAPRVVEVPAELAAAFRSHKAAKATWESLSYSHQREYAEWITSAKKAETRERRVAQAVEKLDAGAKTYR